jgi:hypothetical protein
MHCLAVVGVSKNCVHRKDGAIDSTQIDELIEDLSRDSFKEFGQKKTPIQV